MNKLYFTLFILLSFSCFLVFADIDPSSYSLLLGTIRKEAIERALVILPPRERVDIILMCKEMKKAKEATSLNDAESAYFIYKWMAQNFGVNKFINNDYSATVYTKGEGSPGSLAEIFTIMCNYLKIESKSISGYIKIKKRLNFMNLISKITSTWNYILINGEYYLVDVTMASTLFDGLYFNDYYSDLFFATKPEIFINFHFPKENNWQLLSTPYTEEKFDSLPYVSDKFYLLGFKSFSPENLDINGSGTITFTLNYDESIKEIDIYAELLDYYFTVTEANTKVNYSEGKVEITFDKNNQELLYFIIECEPLYFDSFEDITILTYRLNP